MCRAHCSHTNAIHSWLNEWTNKRTNVWMKTWKKRPTPTLSSASAFFPISLATCLNKYATNITCEFFFFWTKKNYINTERIKTAQHKNKSEYHTHTHILKYLSCFSWPDATCCDECFSVVAHLNAIWQRDGECKKKWHSEGGLLLKRWSFHRFTSHHIRLFGCVCARCVQYVFA